MTSTGARHGAFTPPAEHKNSDGHYLVNAAKLKATFRKRAIARLQWLRKKDKLKLGGKYESLRHDDAWDAFIEKLYSHADGLHFRCADGPRCFGIFSASGCNRCVIRAVAYIVDHTQRALAFSAFIMRRKSKTQIFWAQNSQNVVTAKRRKTKTDGIAFWRSVGFQDYCITMEMDTSPNDD